MVFIYFLKLFCLTLIKLLDYYPCKEYKIIVNHLLGKSFKFPEKKTNNRFIVITYFYRFFKTEVLDFKKSFKKSNIIFDSSPKSKEIRLKYLKYYSKIRHFDFISYDELLYFKSHYFKIFYIIISIPFVLFCFVLCQFLKNRSSLALYIEYPLVLFNFFNVIKKYENLNLYYFSIFERESNFFAYYMIKKGLNVIKIPSEVPISYWNTNILTNDLIICNYYQYEELIEYSNTTKYKKTIFWGPENSFQYNDLYKHNSSTKKNTIGFYSTGSWIRQKVGHIDQGIDFVSHETKVLSFLKEYIQNNNGIRLIIFLHPKEKSDIYKNEVIDYYKFLLGNKINYQISQINISSSKCFSKVDLGIAFSSTIMHERLFCGFKSIFFTRNKFFPIKNTTLYNISADKKSSFINLIDSSLAINTYEFFEKYNLFDYSHREINK